jgi:hypothetical protein
MSKIEKIHKLLDYKKSSDYFNISLERIMFLQYIAYIQVFMVCIFHTQPVSKKVRRPHIGHFYSLIDVLSVVLFLPE